ncbi:ATP-binding protein [Halomonas sp. 1390]|uniref:ATP-binding protein n=1 Tax=Halomonas sp. B23F22_3 TaxID=3459516 RepID=UPI00373E7D93
MTQKIVAVAGVSGVGKSSFIKKLSDDFPVQHLQASSLIREGARIRDLESIGQDFLRELDIDENQALLVLGFERLKDKSSFVVLDCHTVIDTPGGLVPISPSVFRAVGVAHLLVLTDDAEVIEARRRGDKERSRPIRTSSEIFDYQLNSVIQGYNISQEIGVPLTVCKIEHARSLDFIWS